MKFAMHGFGYIGKFHVLAMQLAEFGGHLVEPAEWARCVVRNKDSAAALSAARVFARVSDSLDDLLDPSIAAVDVVSPNHVHLPAVAAAAKAGVAVYCEKPLAQNLATSEQMADVVAHSPVVHQVALMYRFHPAVEQALWWLQSGLLGKPLTFHGRILHGGYLNPERPISWRLNASSAGAGALMDLGVHGIDLVNLLVGKIESVCAHLETFVPQRPGMQGNLLSVGVDDWAHLVLTTVGGAVGTLELSRVHYGLEQNRFTIVCQNGTLDLPLDTLTGALVRLLPEGERTAGVKTKGKSGLSSGPMREVVSGPKAEYPWPPSHRELELPLAPYRPSEKMTQDVLTSCHAVSLSTFTHRVKGEAIPYPVPTFADALECERVVHAAVNSAASQGNTTVVSTDT